MVYADTVTVSVHPWDAALTLSILFFSLTAMLQREVLPPPDRGGRKASSGWTSKLSHGFPGLSHALACRDQHAHVHIKAPWAHNSRTANKFSRVTVTGNIAEEPDHTSLGKTRRQPCGHELRMSRPCCSKV